MRQTYRIVNTLPDTLPLLIREERFCEEMARHGDPAVAVRSGYGMPTLSAREVNRIAENLMARDDIASRIREIAESARSLTAVNVATVLNHWLNLATADPNEVVQHRRVCCRYCWSDEHVYQWTPAEYWDATAKAIDQEKPAPVNASGTWYDKTKGPNPECPECFGDGTGEVHLTDTRLMSPRARLLIESIKMGKHGPEVTLHDRMAPMDNIAKFLGMFKETIRIEDLTKPKSDNVIDVSTMTPEALVEKFRELSSAHGR